MAVTILEAITPILQIELVNVLMYPWLKIRYENMRPLDNKDL